MAWSLTSEAPLGVALTQQYGDHDKTFVYLNVICHFTEQPKGSNQIITLLCKTT